MTRLNFGRFGFAVAVPSLFLCLAASALAQSSTFTYQGRLTDGGTPASGTYDLQFKLYDALTAGNQLPVGSPITSTKSAVLVTNGVFTVQLDFTAAAFPGADRFLEIGVRHPGDPTFTTLLPRQQLTASPYAIHSLAAANQSVATTGATPSVTNITVLVLNYSATATITDLPGGVDGQCVALVKLGSTAVTMNTGGNFRLSGNWAPPADDTLTVCRSSASGSPLWYETARQHPIQSVIAAF